MRTHPAFLNIIALVALFGLAPTAHAALTLTAGSNATTTPNVATSIVGFQIVGDAASTTPVKLLATYGTLSMTTTTGLTFNGASSGSTIYFSGTVANINAALSTLKYTRASTGTDTLEVSLVNQGEVFYTTNGHLYEFVSGSYSWSAAKTAAEARTSYGASGYLATITSLGENNFISARMTGDGWIGANDTQTEGTWKWMTGPENGTTFWQGTGSGSTVGGNYANWNGGEPNQSGDEDCAETYVSNGTWNDLPCSATLGYVVEYGAPGNLPTVVATNISVVTADVPAITSLSPTNGATSASPSSNLVIGFSKTVTKQTGNILIRKVSDDSIVETIDASGALVSGSGTNTITINPASDLAEGTQYYITIPSTAFKDSSDNFYEGFTNTTTWRFTTSDVTAPTISTISAGSLATTTSTLSWTTNENASSKVVFGFTTAYGSTTSERDTSSRVTSHSVPLYGLVACTTYHYAVVSRDTALNSATSSDKTFATVGCEYAAEPTAATSTSITSSSGGSTSIVDGGKTFTVTAPANATATSSSFVIQVQVVPSDEALASIGKPSAKNEVGITVFDVKAIVNSTTILDSFDAEVTIDYEYEDADIAGLDESSLWLYHYSNGAWSALNDCVRDMTANTISCTTPSFSIFGLFGSGESANRSGSRPKVRTLAAVTEPAQVPVVTTAAPLTTVCAPHIRSYIQYGAVNDVEDVKRLETFLNEKQGESLEVNGIYEEADVAAVKRFQQKYSSEVLGAWGLSTPTGYIFRTTLMKINSFYCSASISCPAFVEHNSIAENNVSAEVAKTKTLLSELGFYAGPIDSTFDAGLESSLKGFQSAFGEVMLKPWNLSKPTGYKYKTTNKFLNMIVGCKTGEVELDGKGTFDY